MKSWKSRLRSLPVILALFASHTALADSQLEFSRQQGSVSGTLKVYIRDNLVYLPAINPKPRVDFIFDNSTQYFTVIDHANKRYTQFNEAELNQLIQQSQSALSALQGISQQLGQLSPSLQKSFGGMIPENTVEQNLSYQDTGKTRAIAGLSCHSYLVLNDSQPITALCLATSSIQSKLGADYTPIATMLTVARRITNQSRSLASVFKVSLPQLGSELEGIPLEVVDAPSSSKIRMSDMQTGLDLSDLPLSIPDGYNKVSLVRLATNQ